MTKPRVAVPSGLDQVNSDNGLGSAVGKSRPAESVEVLAKVPTRQRLTYAVGDVHGRFDLLTTACERIQAHAAGREARVILLGDYVDRGPQSRDVVELLMQLTADPEAAVTCLRGNHEQLMIDGCRGNRASALEHWVQNGGGATLNGYSDGVPREHIAWMEALPLVAHDEHRTYVHAGLMPGFSRDEQEPETCMWIRERFLRAGDEFGTHVVHGHTPIWDGKPYPEAPELLPHRTNLDTAAFASGVLTVGVFDDAVPGGPVEVLSVSLSA